MSQPAIEVSGLSKHYSLQHESRHDNLRDTLHHTARKLWRRMRWGTSFGTEEFWALRDISFSVEPGEVVGIIGRNGAGKSTLLKVLSRITEPTAGKVTLRGRVASLLEVGTGFHPELTGRENIYLNGAILGMSRAEIRRKFDEIVAFAEVERFLDTPVKRYSSGMYVRLAFSVAAHLEPEILIVDEVLAVGDQAFQDKCLGKLREVARGEGRTVLFVSHNLSVVQAICKRAILLSAGQIAAAGRTEDCVSAYLSRHCEQTWTRPKPSDLPLQLLFAEARVETAGTGEPWVRLNLTVLAAAEKRAVVEVLLHDAYGQNLAIGQLRSASPRVFTPGEHRVEMRFPAQNLAIGRYQISLRLMIPGIENLDTAMHILAFDFEAPPSPGASHRLQQAWGGGSFMLELQPV